MTKTELTKLRDRILVVKCKVYVQLCKGIRKHKTYCQLGKMWKSVDAQLTN